MAQIRTALNLSDVSGAADLTTVLDTLATGLAADVRALGATYPSLGPVAVRPVVEEGTVQDLVDSDTTPQFAAIELAIDVPQTQLDSADAVAFKTAVLDAAKLRLETLLGAAGTNEHQTVAVVADSGDFPLTFEGQTVTGIAFNATGAAVKAALASLNNVDAAELTVTGGPVNVSAVNVEFKGRWAGRNVATMTSSTANLVGSGKAVTIATPTAGVSVGSATVTSSTKRSPRRTQQAL